jgi:hypothetical protein
MPEVAPLRRGPDYAECRGDRGINRVIWVT